MIRIYLPVAKQRTIDQLQEEGIFSISLQVARNTEDIKFSNQLVLKTVTYAAVFGLTRDKLNNSCIHVGDCKMC